MCSCRYQKNNENPDQVDGSCRYRKEGDYEKRYKIIGKKSMNE